MDTIRDIAVIGIDGVLTDPRHRLDLITSTPPRWRAYFDAAAVDPPLPHGLDLVHTYATTNDVIYLTNRPARIGPLTRHWLVRHGLPDAPLLMHPGGTTPPTHETKLAHLRKLRRARYITTVVDDDPELIELLTTHHFPAQHANWLSCTS